MERSTAEHTRTALYHVCSAQTPPWMVLATTLGTVHVTLLWMRCPDDALCLAWSVSEPRAASSGRAHCERYVDVGMIDVRRPLRSPSRALWRACVLVLPPRSQSPRLPHPSCVCAVSLGRLKATLRIARAAAAHGGHAHS